MSLDTRPPRQHPVRQVATPRERQEQRGMPSRSLLLALVLACIALMVVDSTSGDDSPAAPVRRVAGEVLGPAQAGASAVLEPIVALPDALHTNADLRHDLAEAEARLADYRRAERTAPYRNGRLGDVGDLCAMATGLGFAVAPARVVGYGAAQSFSSTVTIDAGTDAGVAPDQTVFNGDGLVGRVLEVTSHTATVLLLIDADSTVGGRIGADFENGFVDGRGGLETGTPLELRLIDNTVMPRQGDAVVTWGSEGAGPYVAGVPIGEVARVYEDLRAGTYRATLEPYVDFTALGDVGVVVPDADEHRVIEPGACG